MSHECRVHRHLWSAVDGIDSARFEWVVARTSPRRIRATAVTQAEHQAFTNAWRQAIPYGEGTANATPACG